MYSHICYLQSTHHPDDMYHFILLLPVRTFSRLVGEADYPPIRPPAVSITVDICPLVRFVFTRGVAQQLVLSEKYQGLSSVLEGSLKLSVSKDFGGGYEVVGEFNFNFRVRWWVSSFQFSQRSLLFSPS